MTIHFEPDALFLESVFVATEDKYNQVVYTFRIPHIVVQVDSEPTRLVTGTLVAAFDPYDMNRVSYNLGTSTVADHLMFDGGRLGPKCNPLSLISDYLNCENGCHYSIPSQYDRHQDCRLQTVGTGCELSPSGGHIFPKRSRLTVTQI